MKLCFCTASLLLVAMMNIFLVSCKDDDASYFVRRSYMEYCFLDSCNVYSLEETVGRSLDASCSISNENENVAELQVDKETGQHIIVPKKIGTARVKLVRGEEEVTVMIVVKTEALDYWKIEERIENIDCTSSLKEEIRSDIYEAHVLPRLSVDGIIYFGYGSKGRWWLESLDDVGSVNRQFYVDYAKGDTEYMFYTYPDVDKKQSFIFSLDEVRQPYGGEPAKYGTFTCDLTDYYQQKYGQDKVKRVVLSYKVRTFRMIF